MKCPSCNKGAGTVYKCDVCGEVRCSSGSCKGTMGGGQGSGGLNLFCKACKKGKYRKIS
tara:strand:- start:225 stop:401 length:177 start_codon:yes stop_codon:yes gene_type:complete